MASNLKPAIFVKFACVVLALPSSIAAQRWTISNEVLHLGKGADELFEWVAFGRLFPDGGSVVADVRGLNIRSYAPDGTRLFQVGRRGSGPGEFRSIIGLWVAPTEEIGVWDGIASRFTFFGRADGKTLSTQIARAEEGFTTGLDIFLGNFSNGDLLLGKIRVAAPKPGEVVHERWILTRFASNGEFRGTLGQVQGMSRMHRAPLPFSPIARIAIRNDSIWFNQGYDANLSVLDGNGKVVPRVSLTWSPRSSPNAWSTLEANLRKLNKQNQLSLLRDVPRPHPLPLVGGLLMDDEGNFWIKEYDDLTDAIWVKHDALESGPGGRWRVLSQKGIWLATVDLPPKMIPLDIRGGRILGIERDEFDVETAVVRMIRRLP